MNNLKLKMRMSYSEFFLLLVLLCSLGSIHANTCEESETSHVKLDLAKQSIITAKSLIPNCEDKKTDSNCSMKDRSLAHLNAALDLISEAKPLCRPCPESKIVDPIEPQVKGTPTDCSEILAQGFNKSGVYQIWPRISGVISNRAIDVFCDMETDGGGWTVIQRRGNFSERTNFSRNWEDYKRGFGDLKGEFWLGNDNMHVLTNQSLYSARFDLVDVNRVHKYALYNVFSIGDEDSGYVLHITDYSGNATNDMKNSNWVKFSTIDRQNDNLKVGYSCMINAERAPFWYSSGCGYVNLNGIYQPGVVNIKGIWWFSWKKNHEGLYYVDIKIRRRNLQSSSRATG